MSADQQYQRMNAFRLSESLSQYISDNARSSSVEDRWLANELNEALHLVREVRNNNLGPDLRARVTKFRAEELEVELQEKRQAVEKLEKDLKKIRAA